MFKYLIDTTTKFWSEDELVALIREKDPGFVLKEGSNFWLSFRYTKAHGNECLLKYKIKTVGEFNFASFDWGEETPTWERQIDTRTGKPKFRLYIQNRHPVADIYETSEAPPDIHIRPDGYDPAMQMAWQYEKNEEGRNVIEIFRVEDGQRHLIYTLTSTDFESSDYSWLKARNPIVIQKHRGYITICPSAHLARTWATAESYRGNVKYTSYTMSADETAWVSDDVWKVLNTFVNTDASGNSSPRGRDHTAFDLPADSTSRRDRRDVHICDLLDELSACINQL